MSLLTGIHRVEVREAEPTEPVVECLKCNVDFVWWLHPVQLCDECVAGEYAAAEEERL